jgi:hypothetical protein
MCIPLERVEYEYTACIGTWHPLAHTNAGSAGSSNPLPNCFWRPCWMHTHQSAALNPSARAWRARSAGSTACVADKPASLLPICPQHAHARHIIPAAVKRPALRGHSAARRYQVPQSQRTAVQQYQPVKFGILRLEFYSYALSLWDLVLRLCRTCG